MSHPSRHLRKAKGSLGYVDGQSFVALPGGAMWRKLRRILSECILTRAGKKSAALATRGKAGYDTPLSPYLKEAYGYAEELGTPVILAFDLQDAISHEHVRQAVQDSPTLIKAKVDVDKAAKFLSGIRGAVLGVTFREKPYGKIRIDFSDKVTAPPEGAKQLVLETLAVHGASLIELYDWKPSVEGKTFMLEGYLDQGGLRRVFSLFDRPPSLPKQGDEPQVAANPQQRPEDAVVQATKAYVGHISDMLDDLRKKTPRVPELLGRPDGCVVRELRTQDRTLTYAVRG